MASPLAKKDGLAGASLNLFAISLKQELSLHDVKPLILAKVPMKRWTAHRWHEVFENGEGTIGVTAGNLDGKFLTENIQLSSNSVVRSLHGKGWNRIG